MFFQLNCCDENNTCCNKCEVVAFQVTNTRLVLLLKKLSMTSDLFHWLSIKLGTSEKKRQSREKTRGYWGGAGKSSSLPQFSFIFSLAPALFSQLLRAWNRQACFILSKLCLSKSPLWNLKWPQPLCWNGYF